VFGFDRITANHDILGGKASIRGMRISVALVVNLVANGMSTEDIIAEYPDLEPEDIRQALRYAAWVAADDLYTPVFDTLARNTESWMQHGWQQMTSIHRWLLPHEILFGHGIGAKYGALSPYPRTQCCASSRSGAATPA